jgi:hypothetical protein
MDSLDYILGILLIVFYIYKSLYIDLPRFNFRKPRRVLVEKKLKGKRNGK